MLISLKCRLSIVTGGGSGIGAAVAKSLARAGSDVAVLDRNLEAATATATWINTNLDAAGLGGRACPFAVDVSNLEQVEKAVLGAQNQFAERSSLAVAVNCAGITKDRFLMKMTEAEWDAVLNVNLKGTFFVTQTVSRAIIANQAKDPKLVELGGSIVNIASIIGKMGNIGQGNYSASKGAVISFSKTAARELARNKIRVNAVLPGFINTPMAQAVPDKVKEKMALQIPLGAFGEAEDIADMCTFLASDKSKYVTGAAVEVTGGMGM